MDVIDAIRGRRAVRDYAADEIGREQIAELIGTAVLAPSAMNRQPWSFTVVRDRARLQRWSSAAKAHALAGLAGRPGLEHLREALESSGFNIFYNAPALVVISATQQDEFTAADCALAAQTLMLAAYARGLGTCWIGFARIASAGTASWIRRRNQGCTRSRRRSGTSVRRWSRRYRSSVHTTIWSAAPMSAVLRALGRLPRSASCSGLASPHPRLRTARPPGAGASTASHG